MGLRPRNWRCIDARLRRESYFNRLVSFVRTGLEFPHEQRVLRRLRQYRMAAFYLDGLDAAVRSNPDHRFYHSLDIHRAGQARVFRSNASQNSAGISSRFLGKRTTGGKRKNWGKNKSEDRSTESHGINLLR
jgi:hypothetical protein